ncbi:hypothetical protein [Candidatus Palauibacter sp.]|uniref:hypothetical protein n=1 Tax=Candidatus Palauibacter sp. TaxID=3101350 RepID=UPI003B011BF2
MMRWAKTRNTEHQLLEIVRGVRRRWRVRQLIQGVAVTLGIGFAVFFIATFGIDRLRFDDGAVLAFRILLWVAAAGLAAWFVVRPLLRRVSDAQVALYLEEHEPSLKAAFLAAIERAGSPGARSGLDARLLEVAARRARRVDRGRRVERDRLRRSTAWFAGVATAVLLIALFGPAFQGTAGSLLLSPWKTADAANPYAITVEPGDALIARGSDQLVRAFPQGFETDEVEVAVRRGESEVWERYFMTPAAEGAAFEVLLFDLDEPTDYTVSSEGVRSPVFTIEVADLPYVDRIDLEYHFPAYTGLSPRTVEDGGDIAVLRGTEVRLRVMPTMATEAARLAFDGEEEGAALELVDGAFETSFTVTGETFYRIEFMGPGSRFVIGSPDYLVEPLDDQPPGVRISEPGRDTRLSPIEELYVEVEAEDDFGLGRVELLYSVNGGEESSRVLHGAARGGTTQISGGHTFFLEEFGLEPGDVVSYYARATDLRSGGPGGGVESSDIYFVEIRPFDRNFRQAEQGGGGGGGGGAGMGGELSEQQRQIVAATFRLERDENDFDDEEMSENLATLTLLQGRLRQQVEELIAQMQQRGVAGDPSLETVFGELPLAPPAMLEAETKLGERRLREALAPEQRSLQHLQRAEAAFRDVQVQQGGGGGGGTPGSVGAGAEELADLFELELDRLRNQYETVQRGQQQQQDQEVDEALQKLEELARRQQQMNERAAAQPRGAAGGGQGQQQQMIEQTEELARQLQRLAREDDRAEVEESARRLQEAADEMRRAQAQGRRGQGQAEASNALDRLREARRLLENRQVAAVEREVEDAARRAERIAERQRELQSDVNEDPTGGDRDRVTGLRERKAELAREVDQLETDLDRLAREARQDQPDAARRLGEAAAEIRESRLRDKLLFSRGVLGTQSEDYVRNFEEQITRDAENVRARVQAARDALGESDPRRLGRQLDETRDLVRGLESLQERLQQGQEGQQGQGQEGQGQQEGEGGQGQGEQQGQGQGQGGRGGQPGQPGQTPQGGQGFAPGGGGGGGGGPRLSPEDVRQFQREFRERGLDARRLRDELRQEGVDVGDLDRAIAGLDRLRTAGDFDDPEELAALQADVLRGLKDFEFALRRELGSQIERFFLSGSDDVPEEYRELVEAYYRALSEDPPP